VGGWGRGDGKASLTEHLRGVAMQRLLQGVAVCGQSRPVAPQLPRWLSSELSHQVMHSPQSPSQDRACTPGPGAAQGPAAMAHATLLPGVPGRLVLPPACNMCVHWVPKPGSPVAAVLPALACCCCCRCRRGRGWHVGGGSSSNRSLRRIGFGGVQTPCPGVGREQWRGNMPECCVAWGCCMCCLC
jgi:hypothetical protein